MQRFIGIFIVSLDASKGFWELGLCEIVFILTIKYITNSIVFCLAIIVDEAITFSLSSDARDSLLKPD